MRRMTFWTATVCLALLAPALRADDKPAPDIAANEKAALETVRALDKAETAYMKSHSSAGYACALADLQGAGLIDPAIASGKANGYKYELKCPGKATPRTEFQFVARPADQGKTGTRAFCVTERNMVMFSPDGQAKSCLQGERVK
jgi:hypothetical protein